MTRTYLPRRKPNHPKAIAGAALVAAAVCLLVVAPLAVALGQSVETIDATGARQTYVPQTQPSDPAPLPRVEVLDLDGMRTVFVLPPATQPATQPSEPPPPVIEPGTLYAEIGGIPPGAKPVASGDLSKLTGDVLLTSSSGYTVSGDLTKANIYAVTPGAVAFLPAGKQIRIKGVDLAGLTLDGLGKAGIKPDPHKTYDDNANAAVLIDSDCHLHRFRVCRALGVGVNIVGKHSVAYFPEWDHNGAQGRGWRVKGDTGVEGSGYTEYDGIYHDNNALGETNADNKGTRGSQILLVRPHFYRERGGCFWLDNYNENIKIVDGIFEGGPKDKKGNDVFLFRSELGYPGGVELIRPKFIGPATTALSLDESSGVTVTAPTFIGPITFAGQFRNMLRPDDPTGKLKNGKPVDETKFTCRLFGVTITDATYQGSVGPIVASPASNARVSLGNNRITIGPAKAGTQVVKIPQ